MRDLFEVLAQTPPISLTAALMSGLGVLASCVAFLYRQQLKVFEDIQKKLADCEDDRQNLWRAIVKIDPACKAYQGASSPYDSYDGYSSDGMP